jgi:hypothetical protein
VNAASVALTAALDDVAAVLDGPKDSARLLAALCDVEDDEWLVDESLRRWGLIGPDGERPRIVGVEIRALGTGQLEFEVVLIPAPGTVGAWLELDLMPVLGAVALRADEVLVYL